MFAASARMVRWAILLLSFSVLSGCAWVDAEQDSLCRRTIPALMEVSNGLRVLQSVPDGETGVGIRFWLAADAREHRIRCIFAGTGLEPRKRTLAHVTVDGRAIGPSALFYLADRWLASQASIAAEPPPASGRPLLDDVSPEIAYRIQQLLSSLPKMGIYALLAASYALIYGLVGRINMAFGAFAALGGISAVMAIVLVENAGFRSIPYGIAAGALVAVALSGLFGMVAARTIVGPLAARTGQQALIASIGLMVALEEFMRISQGAGTVWLPPIFNVPIAVARSATYDATMTPMAVAVAASAGAAAFTLLSYLKGSRFGRDWLAVADDPGAAELFGISATSVLVRSFAVACAMAGFAGMLIVTYYGGIGFAGGTMLGLTALVAAILGGIGSIGGAMTGGVLIGLIEAVWSSYWPIEHKDAVIFVLLSLVLILKPNGLFAGRQPGPMRV